MLLAETGLSPTTAEVVFSVVQIALIVLLAVGVLLVFRHVSHSGRRQREILARLDRLDQRLTDRPDESDP